MPQKRNATKKTTDTFKPSKSELNRPLFIYDLNGVLKCETTIAAYIKEAKTTYKSINLAARSYKNYGYINNKKTVLKEFVSLSAVTKFYTTDEVMTLFAKWMRKRLPYHLKNFQKLYEDDYNDVNEFTSMALCYIMNTIRLPESNNNFESSLIYKYKMCRIDVNRSRRIRRDNGEISDFDIRNEKGSKCSFIQSYGDRMVYDKGDIHNCVADENYSKQIESIGIILKQYVVPDKVDFFLSIVEWQEFDFTDKPSFKNMTIARRYKEHIMFLMENYPPKETMSATNYIQVVIDECWSAIVNYRDEIIDLSISNVYKDFDDLELCDFNSGVSHLKDINNAIQ
jgi:hypothetical protein